MCEMLLGKCSERGNGGETRGPRGRSFRPVEGTHQGKVFKIGNHRRSPELRRHGERMACGELQTDIVGHQGRYEV